MLPVEKIEDVVLKNKCNFRTQALFVENKLLELKVDDSSVLSWTASARLSFHQDKCFSINL